MDSRLSFGARDLICPLANELNCIDFKTSRSHTLGARYGPLFYAMLIHPAHRPESIPGVWSHPFPSYAGNGRFGFHVFPGMAEKLGCGYPVPTTPAVGIADPSVMVGQFVFSGPVLAWNKQSCSAIPPQVFSKELSQNATSGRVYVEKSLGYGAFGVVW